jgi:hypothetical protein
LDAMCRISISTGDLISITLPTISQTKKATSKVAFFTLAIL